MACNVRLCDTTGTRGLVQGRAREARGVGEEMGGKREGQKLQASAKKSVGTVEEAERRGKNVSWPSRGNSPPLQIFFLVFLSLL